MFQKVSKMKKVFHICITILNKRIMSKTVDLPTRAKTLRKLKAGWASPVREIFNRLNKEVSVYKIRKYFHDDQFNEDVHSCTLQMLEELATANQQIEEKLEKL